MVNYKNTLNLPETKFTMKANLVIQEPIRLKSWYLQNLYQIIRKIKKGKKVFILHDGPPYANGDIHLGHAINKILKDITIKSRGLMGYDVPYLPGWDCHGLPIMLNVKKIISKLSTNLNREEFYNICRKYVFKQIKTQKNDFIRLGILGDWNNAYLTMNFITEANIIRTFSKIISKGYLYLGFKPVHWCINCKSTLAAAEIEFQNCKSDSIYVSFPVTDLNNIKLKFNINQYIKNISFLIWTTTPWTLPANKAIAINPKYFYQLILINQQGYIIVADQIKTIMNNLNIKNWEILGKIQGSELELINVNHPFMNYNVPVIFSEYVVLNMGTGIVHIAPGHGIEDYIVSKKYNLEIINLIDINGNYLPGILPELDNLNISEVNHKLIDLLNKNYHLMYHTYINHKYPYCYRHKIPIIFRTTKQWFINLDHNNLRSKLLLELNKVTWIPKSSKNNISAMIKNHPDWCISRQRIWGVPMALVVHKITKKLHPNIINIMHYVAALVEKKGIQAWWHLNLHDIIGNDVIFYSKINDTLDVWFDAGSTFDSILVHQKEFNNNIADIYLEGIDQHRGWFISSLIISMILNNQAPYRCVLTHSFVIDDSGKKMSKSFGNIIKPQQIVDKFGADILRLWISSTNYTKEINITNEIIERSIDIYRRIRNTTRFLLANLKNFNPIFDIIKPQYMVALDLWILNITKKLQIKIIIAYKKYEFFKIIKYIMKFCSIELGSIYLDLIKDRQYTIKFGSNAHRSCQTTLYHILESLVRWISPIISFTADEIWHFIPGNEKKYLFAEEWYNGISTMHSKYLIKNNFWETIMQIRDKINKIIEQSRIQQLFHSSLEIGILFYVKKELFTLLSILGEELRYVFLVSYTKIIDYTYANANSIKCQPIKGLKIELIKINGEKCQRCWHYENNIKKYKIYSQLCTRCISNIDGIGEKRKFI